MSSIVYFVPASKTDSQEILGEKTKKIFLELDMENKIQRDSFVALKIHFGEMGNTGHIKPSWLLPMINLIKNKTPRVYITDTNTLYVGNRSNSVEHLNLAAEHGFSFSRLGIPIIIADGLIGRDYDEIQVNLPRIKSAKLASSFFNSDVLVSLSHFTGHILTGFGAALKNLGMGCASRVGKLEQHSDIQPHVKQKKCKLCRTCFSYCPADAIIEKNDKAYIKVEKCIGCGECLVVCPVGAVKMTWDESKLRIQEKMTEYAFSVQSLFKEKTACLNFLIKMTKDCDCMCRDAPSILPDIGILASQDPVALDLASVELVNKRAGKDILRSYNDLDWSVQFEHAERIGFGNTDYQLIEI